LCGAACGAAITRSYLHSKMATYGGQGHFELLNLKRLKAELSLTPDQERIVTKELDDYAKYYQNIEDEREDVAEHGRQRILSILTPDQKKQFNKLFVRASQYR
jgi:hypothetical protein